MLTIKPSMKSRYRSLTTLNREDGCVLISYIPLLTCSSYSHHQTINLQSGWDGQTSDSVVSESLKYSYVPVLLIPVRMKQMWRANHLRVIKWCEYMWWVIVCTERGELFFINCKFFISLLPPPPSPSLSFSFFSLPIQPSFYHKNQIAENRRKSYIHT